MKALGYAASLEGHSLRRQKNNVRSRFGREYRIYWRSDQGITDLSARPELAELVATAISEEIGFVLVDKFTCFGRAPEIQAAIIGVLNGFGLTIHAAQDNMFAAEAIAAAVSVTISGMIDALRGRGLLMSRGGRRRPGPKPYGQSNDPEQATQEKHVKDEIVRLKASGWGVGRIAKKLNADGARTRRGCLWHAQSVARVLVADL